MVMIKWNQGTHSEEQNETRDAGNVDVREYESKVNIDANMCDILNVYI